MGQGCSGSTSGSSPTAVTAHNNTAAIQQQRQTQLRSTSVVSLILSDHLQPPPQQQEHHHDGQEERRDDEEEREPATAVEGASSLKPHFQKGSSFSLLDFDEEREEREKEAEEGYMKHLRALGPKAPPPCSTEDNNNKNGERYCGNPLAMPTWERQASLRGSSAGTECVQGVQRTQQQPPPRCITSTMNNTIRTEANEEEGKELSPFACGLVPFPALDELHTTTTTTAMMMMMTMPRSPHRENNDACFPRKTTTTTTRITYAAEAAKGKNPTAATPATPATTTPRNHRHHIHNHGHSHSSLFEKFVTSYKQEKEDLQDSLRVLNLQFKERSEEKEEIPIAVVDKTTGGSCKAYPVSKRTLTNVRGWVDVSNWKDLEDPEARATVPAEFHSVRNAQQQQEKGKDSPVTSSPPSHSNFPSATSTCSQSSKTLFATNTSRMSDSGRGAAAVAECHQRARERPFSSSTRYTSTSATVTSTSVAEKECTTEGEEAGNPLIAPRTYSFSKEIGRF